MERSTHVGAEAKVVGHSAVLVATELGELLQQFSRLHEMKFRPYACTLPRKERRQAREMPGALLKTFSHQSSLRKSTTSRGKAPCSPTSLRQTR
jgi:hypothetical protein